MSASSLRRVPGSASIHSHWQLSSRSVDGVLQHGVVKHLERCRKRSDEISQDAHPAPGVSPAATVTPRVAGFARLGS